MGLYRNSKNKYVSKNFRLKNNNFETYRSAAVGCACGFMRKHLEAHGLVTLLDSIFQFLYPMGLYYIIPGLIKYVLNIIPGLCLMNFFKRKSESFSAKIK